MGTPVVPMKEDTARIIRFNISIIFTAGINHIGTSIGSGIIIRFDTVVGRISADSIVNSDNDLCLIGDPCRKLGQSQNEFGV